MPSDVDELFGGETAAEQLAARVSRVQPHGTGTPFARSRNHVDGPVSPVDSGAYRTP